MGEKIIAVISNDNRFVERIKSICSERNDVSVHHIQAVRAIRRTIGVTDLRVAIVDDKYTNEEVSTANQAIREIKGSYPSTYVLLMADTSISNPADLLVLKKSDDPKVMKAIRYYLDMPNA